MGSWFFFFSWFRFLFYFRIKYNIMRDPVRFELRSPFSPNEKDDDVAHESLFSRSSFLSCFLAFSLRRGVVVCWCSCLLFVVALAFPSWLIIIIIDNNGLRIIPKK